MKLYHGTNVDFDVIDLSKSKKQTDFLVNRIVDRITEYLALDYNLEIPEALKVVYKSKVYELLQDAEGDLFLQSPSYIYELLKEEINE